MSLMFQSAVDEILTGVVTSAAYGLLPVPTAWQTTGFDIMMFELWSSAALTIGYSSTEADGVVVAANAHQVLAIRKTYPKNTTTIPGIYVKSAASIYVLAHRVVRPYADQV